ncbi:MAG: lysophospholipid acyltransferase family protein [Deltaproteobacteria bacterium]|nr:lysophospholipid acyltransferase family protein [Deltaproteobacteria bacterium]
MARPRTWWFRLTVAVGGWLGAALLRALGATWRVRQVADDDPTARGEPAIGALWHRALFPAAWRFRDLGAAIPVSRSRDGDRIVAVLDRLGYGPSPRGSSSRGGPGALAGAIRAAREGRVIGVLCDGPRGPARRCKPGVLAIARATGLPLHPVAIAARPALTFPSWDRTVLPLPFARVLVAGGAPIPVPADAGREELERLRQALEQELERLQHLAESEL